MAQKYYRYLTDSIPKRIEPQLFGRSNDPVARDLRIPVLSDPNRINPGKFVENSQNFTSRQVNQVDVFVQFLTTEMTTSVTHFEEAFLNSF